MKLYGTKLNAMVNLYQRCPEMAAITKKYLCCPASPVYCERLFSEVGNAYDIKRSRLLPDRAEHLNFLPDIVGFPEYSESTSASLIKIYTPNIALKK